MGTSTMKDILVAIFGTYTPVTTEVSITAADGTVSTVEQYERLYRRHKDTPDG